MSRQFSKWCVLPAAVLLLGTMAVAQDPSSGGSSSSGGSTAGSSTPSSTPAKQPTVAQRKENQQDRIAQGVKSGQLTAGETANLESKEAAINGETRADRAANGGKLTSSEKQQINKQQNQLSKQIYNDKHNAATQNYGKSEVGQRQTNQQQRIAQGVKSGQLTAGETAKLENQQRGINQQVKADRAANGGKLTGAEKQQINKEQNAASKNIYNKKHNAKTQAGTKK
jgi:predicted transglutaminase-like cysteine proteinase